MIPFAQAKAYQMPFGKYRGKSLDTIARTDEGLLYLDWLRGEQGESDQRPAAIAIRAYLDDDSIQRDLDKAHASRRREQS